MALSATPTASSLLSPSPVAYMVDALVFTGGIGENSPAMRARIVGHLQCFALALDPDANHTNGREAGGFIQSTASPANILVVPTQEEWLIAQETVDLIRARNIGS